MLTVEGFEVEATDLGEEGLASAKRRDHDIVLLDLNLPDLHGYEVLRRLREATVNTPVLVVSGIADVDSKVCCFGVGADDYIIKPFHREELLIRMRAVANRARRHAETIIRTGRLTVNLDAKVAEIDGVAVPLTGKEYAILELLSLRKGMILTKEMFVNHLYNGMDEPEFKIIDVFICKLRKKMAQVDGSFNCIETVWGRGYKMSDPDELQLAA
jgi:two-component system cell cycle response regulator CtrA